MKRRISDKLAQFAADEGGFATHFALTVLILILLLIFRPQGLFGGEREQVR